MMAFRMLNVIYASYLPENKAMEDKQMTTFSLSIPKYFAISLILSVQNSVANAERCPVYS